MTAGQPGMDDLRLVILKWQQAAAQSPFNGLSRAPWWRAADVGAYAEDCISQAAKVVAERQWPSSSRMNEARFCIVTKQPHAGTGATITAMVSRFIAFGIKIHEVREVTEGGEKVAEILYPTAYSHFADLPQSRAVWDALARRFDNEKYTRLFGEPYSPKQVLCGAWAMDQYGLSAAELTDLWEEGRKPISRHRLADTYGPAAIKMLGNDESYQWFRGDWPLGIQRIASGIMAFALRHDRLGAGRPVILLNGHFPGLAALFSQGTVLVEAGLRANGAGIAEVRRWVVGHDNRPSDCLPGTIRRDAAEGIFPVSGDSPVDSRRNVLHCSDGLLSGMIECRSLFRGKTHGGALANRLRSVGLTSAEIEHLIMADPMVRVFGTDHRLTELTKGQSLDACVATITRTVPPVFGRTNGFASGLSLACLTREFARLFGLGGDCDLFSHRETQARVLQQPVSCPSSLPDDAERAGIELLSLGGVGFLVPVGGTGGRLGGYDVPEAHPRRQKALIPAFSVGGALRSSLSIRLANVTYWRRRTGGDIPIAIMTSPTNRDLVESWCVRRRAEGAENLSTYQQYGTYRVRAELFTEPSTHHKRWIDEILRFENGAPDLKPPGNLGTLTCFVLSGLLSAWSSTGVEILAIANGDDIGFRLEPKVLGLMSRDPSIDAVVMGTPWGVHGGILTPQGSIQVRGNVSGECITDTGARGRLTREKSGQWTVHLHGHKSFLQDPTFDLGGSVCELRGKTGWRPGIAERPPLSGFAEFPLFSTNQIYVRTSSLRRAMGLSPSSDIAATVSRFVGFQPFYAERKAISRDDGQDEAVQLSQGANDILRHMSIVPLIVHGAGSARTRYASLKRPEDVLFAQIILNEMMLSGDDLAFDWRTS